MTIRLIESRTELVVHSAEEVCHIFCDHCWSPGQPMMCGEPDTGTPPCPDDCGHPLCSMCVLEWDRHLEALHSR